MSAANSGARKSVADFWDAVLADWLDGRRDLRPPLDRWFASYQGKGPGAIDLAHYPDPFIGDLRGQVREPRLVVLGLNPGVGYDELQSADGVWARRIAKEGYSTCLRRSPHEDSETWVRMHGKPSTYWTNLIRFARLWLVDDGADVHDLLNFELYPWHSKKVTGVMKPPSDVIDELVWNPIAELDVNEVFAFGADWFDVCEAQGLPKLAMYGAGHPFPHPHGVSSWRLGIYELPTGQVVVVSSQAGYAGPPGRERLETMRSLVTEVYRQSKAPGSQHDPNVGIPWEVLAGLEAHSVRHVLRVVTAHLAQSRSITADPARTGYVALRPVHNGAISVYVHTDYLDLALPTDSAVMVQSQRGWRLVKSNPTTAILRIREDDVRETGGLEAALSLVLEAHDHRELGPKVASVLRSS